LAQKNIDPRTGRPKIILDLCGGTGAWSKPYREAGYDVRLITLPEHDVRTYEPPADVWGILAAPPCTEFSLAKGSKPRDFAGAIEIVAACMQIIWNCRAQGGLRWWALENPKGFMRQFLGSPAFSFEHWNYGDDQIKPTDLWGYFNAPPFVFRQKPLHMTILYPGGRINGRGWSKPKCPPEYEGMNLSRASLRAITPPGFAQAFFNANP
jgi:hypothetical protein